MTTPQPDDTAVHVHRRDWRPCPWIRPDPLTPTKAVSRWLFAWAAAFQHEHSFEAFAAEHPADFPELAS